MVAEVTVGSITSDFPVGTAGFSTQTEANDPVSEDPDFAEGRDANKWSAEIAAVQNVVGANDRGFVTIDNSVPATPTADVGAFTYMGKGSCGNEELDLVRSASAGGTISSAVRWGVSRAALRNCNRRTAVTLNKAVMASSRLWFSY